MITTNDLLNRHRRSALSENIKVSEEEMTECEKLFMKNEYTEAVIFSVILWYKIKKLSTAKNINNDANALTLLGNCYVGKRDRTEKDEKCALEAYIKASKIDEDNKIILSKIANVFYDQGEMDLSIKFYQKALKIDPDSLDLRINLGKNTNF